MSEQETRSPYEQAIAQFDALEAKSYSPDSYIAALVEIQSVGFTTGVEHKTLFTVLERMTGDALVRAKEVNDPSTSILTNMKQGYRSALERLNPTQPKTPPRPQTGVAAG